MVLQLHKRICNSGKAYGLNYIGKHAEKKIKTSSGCLQNTGWSQFISRTSTAPALRCKHSVVSKVLVSRMLFEKSFANRRSFSLELKFKTVLRLKFMPNSLRLGL